MRRLLSQLSFPLVQAPMAYAQGVELTAAVCRAGALGSLPAAMFAPDTLDAALHELRSLIGDAPYNLNFFAHRPQSVTAEQRATWHRLLAPHLARFGLAESDIPTDAGRNPFDEAMLEVVRRHRPAVVSFHFGLPQSSLLTAVKDSGALVLGNATTADEARWLEGQGADGIIVQGLEAGGHRGMFLSSDLTRQSGLFALLPNVRRAVSLPLIAAGGISDSAAVRAALDLGADAVQCGSAFLLADEAKTSPAYRAALQSPQAADTVLTNLFSGGIARGIRSAYIDEAGPINPAALPFPQAGAAAGLLRRAAEQAGSSEYSSFWAGQNVLAARPGSAAKIVARLAAGFQAA